MADRPSPLETRPVLAGLLALVGVALVVGLVAGVAVLAGTQMLGLGGSDDSAAETGANAGETLYLPEPSLTDGPSGPLITLNPDGPTPSPSAGSESESSNEKSKKGKKKKQKQKEISLSAGQGSVSPMQRIDLTGTYPQGEGAILQVQRFEDGSWSNFPVTVSVGNGTFSTYVQTGQLGKTRFRVVDTDSRAASNEVVVQVG